MVELDHIQNLTGIDRDEDKFSSGDVTFELISSILVWVQVPGCGFFYSGMASRKNALGQVLISFWAIAVVSIQWYAIGYSLSFSTTASPFIGNFKNVFLRGVFDGVYADARRIPELSFCLYQGVTANLAPSMIMGVIAERGRMVPAILFILLWTTLVYDPIACWSLNPRGWSARLGVLDFGGGAPVHVPAGAAAFAYTLMLGPGLPTAERTDRPHNMVNIMIGTTLIWFGSFGYNSGSAYAGNMIGIMASLTCNLSGSAGAITWVLLDYRKEKKLSAFGFCAGAVVGLVCVTTGSGFISPTSSILYGICGAAASNFGLKLNSYFKFEDTLDVMAMHGISGVVGNLLTGILAQKSYGGVAVGEGGWVDGHWMQMVYQLADTVAAFGWSFTVSFLLLYGMNKVPCLRLRVSPEIERDGVIDEAELGVKCYEFIQGIVPNDPPDRITVIATNGVSKEHHENNINSYQRPPNHDAVLRNNWI